MDAPDERMMRLALEEARAAAAGGDVPVGAVIVRGDEILARAGNAREREQDPTAHAEIRALRRASSAIGSWHLEG
ncbi:MAG TPA: deaminase, partial [Actinomycetota bacterium]|nr:deaminase [Actinomycetota bacterium]